MLCLRYALTSPLLLPCYDTPWIFRYRYTSRAIALRYMKGPKGGLKDRQRNTKGGFVFIVLIFFVLFQLTENIFLELTYYLLAFFLGGISAIGEVLVQDAINEIMVIEESDVEVLF